MSTADDRLPHNLDAERSVLGAILLDNAMLEPARAQLQPKYFFLRQNQQIFETMIALHEAGHAVDSVTLMNRLEELNRLDDCGGAAYIGTLMDGVPRVSNVAHYAQIVSAKFRLRDAIHFTEKIQRTAMEGLISPDDIAAQLELYLKGSTNGNGKPKLKTVDVTSFLAMNLRPIEYVLSPVFPVQGLIMVYAKRGRGKTYIMLETAYSIACGKSCFGWDCETPRRLLYVDGEMPANAVQERLRKIYKGHSGKLPEPGYLNIITSDLQDGRTPNIATGEGQRMIEEHLQEGFTVFLDNLSALCRSGKENESDSWNPVQEWLLQLRKHMITVVLLHHAGKGGDQRGTSAHEDALDTVISLREPHDYSAAEGLRIEVHFTKLRHSPGGPATFPFEVKLEDDTRGGVIWTQRPLKDVIDQQIVECLKVGMTPREISEELHVHRRKVYHIKTRLKAGEFTFLREPGE